MTDFRRLLLLAGAAAVAAALLAACSATGAINALVRSDTYRPTLGIAYGALPRQKLDVYTPVSAAPAAGWPVVVFFYGGNWTDGERGEYKFMSEALASHGVLTLIADYRLYPEVTYPAFLEDCAKAMAYGFEHAQALGGDPKRVFVMGHSAGGYNAAMLALDPRWLAATGHSPKELDGWIGLAGAYDFFPLEPGQPARPVFHHPDYPANAQPIDDVTAASPKAFLAAPVKDKVVSPERSTLAMAAKLRAAGVPVEEHSYDGISHALLAGVFARPLRGLAPALDDVTRWINAN
ncbi:MAG: alpha/beta hydrolase [Pseudomonadota bacterium]|nr:alpha/beta hydrolase [Pseudomonadota bacterium]